MRFTVRSLAARPCFASAADRCAALSVVHSSGPVGSPRVAGSSSRFSAFSSPGSFSSARFRPAPRARCRPVASQTRVTPPRPSARASVAAHSRRPRSSSSRSITEYFSAIASVTPSSMTSRRP